MNGKNLSKTKRFYATLAIAILVIVISLFGIFFVKDTLIRDIILETLLVVLIAILLRRNLKGEEKIDTAETLIGLLGDMYYAIYRINFVENTYECIKTLPELEKVLGKNGDFDHLAQVLKDSSWPRNNDSYLEQNKLYEIMKNNNEVYSYYGGEFKQKFGDEYKWVNTHIIKDGKLPAGESIWCFRLVDDEKKKELEATKILKETLQQAEAKEKNKSQFFSQMSHDMRTPLNAIIGFAELSNSHTDDANCLKEYIDKIDKSAKQLLLLINDILEYSKIGESIHRLEKIKFNFNDLLNDVKTTFEENAAKEDKSIIFEVNVQHKSVAGDKNKLVKILNNLVSNSLKYSTAGDTVKIIVDEIDNQSKFQITVLDNGIGMSEEFIERVFEPYAREMRVISQKDVVGTGLGMLIVKNLVTIMKGDISVKSKKEIGTRISITLPLEIVEDDEISEVQQGDFCVDKQLEEKIFFNGKKILVAEDNQLNMEILCEMLKMRGVEVTKAWNGQEAVDLFDRSEEGYFDCILMDMYMPVMDGCEATRRIRVLHHSDSKTIPIIAVTANAFAEDINKTEAAGMNGHMSKPIDFNLLYQMMKKHIEN